MSHRSVSRIAPFLLFCVMLALLSSCRVDDAPERLSESLTPTTDPTQVESSVELSPLPETTSSPPASATAAVLLTPTLEAQPTEQPPVPTPSPYDLAIRANDISHYPYGPIYEGDLVSIRIDPRIPERLAPNEVDVRIFIDGVPVISNKINWRSLDGEPFGLYQWAWDSNGQEGLHRITVFLDPDDTLRFGDNVADNNVAATTIQVMSSDIMPESQADARWMTEETTCCRVHVISGTDAHRDIRELLVQVESAFQQASEILGESITGRYNVYLVDRVFGHGGYAQNAMVVSYTDRDYIGGGLDELMVHEAVHLIDRRFASNPITFLSEGLAVWAAGGHYHPNDLEKRMAALLELDRFQPLELAIDNFFNLQHEIAYLQGAGFVDYLVSTYGWEAVKGFYSETSAKDGDTLSAAVDANLRRSFGRSLDQVEADWVEQLRTLPQNSTEVDDLRTMLRFYQVVRRYQSSFDPTAYYLTTWLPDPEVAQRVGATADFSRKPDSAVNVALEAMLVSASAAFELQEYDKANALVDSIERVLDNNGAFLDPLALSYLNIVLTAQDLGLEALQIELDGDRAVLLGSDLEDRELVQVDLELGEGRNWTLAR